MRLRLLAIGCLVLAASLVLIIDSHVRNDAKAAAPPAAPPGSVTNYQQNALHDGRADGSLSSALTAAWSQDLGGKVGHPLIVNGRVFVAAATAAPAGAQLWALDESTGATVWGPVDVPGGYRFVALVADGASVYASNSVGTVRSYDQVTGAENWEAVIPGSYGFATVPTISDGTIFLGSVYHLLAAFRAEDGALVLNAAGNGGVAAVTADAAYVSNGCAFRLDRITVGASLEPFHGLWGPPGDAGRPRRPGLRSRGIH